MQQAVLAALGKRWRYLCQNTSGSLLAHALNPMHLGEDFDDCMSTHVMEYLQLFPGEQRVTLVRQYMAFRAKRDILPFELDHVENPYDWWCVPQKRYKELAASARRVMLMMGTATECERAWKNYNCVVTKHRNRLASERASKLAKLHHHIRANSCREDATQVSTPVAAVGVHYEAAAAAARAGATAAAAAAANANAGPAAAMAHAGASVAATVGDGLATVGVPREDSWSSDSSSDDSAAGSWGRAAAAAFGGAAAAAAAESDSDPGTATSSEDEHFGGTLDYDEVLAVVDGQGGALCQ